MARARNRGWMWFSLIGIGLWVGATVAVTVINDDPADGRPVLLTFGAGGAVFFGIVFAAAFRETRPRSDPELDALLAELAVEPLLSGRGAAAIGAMRRVARTYVLLGAAVTALGLAAIVQEGLEVGSARTTLTAMVVLVVLWALAVPFVIRTANRSSGAILTPLGIEQAGAALVGERHGRRVRIDLTSSGWITRLDAETAAPAMSGDEIAAYAGRGNAEVWRGVSVEPEEGRITVRREGHSGPTWLWDLWLAERLAGS